MALSIVLGIHCILDGLAVSAATTVERAFGIRVLAGMAIHKLPEGFALGTILIAGGRSTWRALGWAAAIEAATLGGPMTTLVWTHPSGFWLSLVLAQTGGTLLYLSGNALWNAAPLAPRLIVTRT